MENSSTTEEVGAKLAALTKLENFAKTFNTAEQYDKVFFRNIFFQKCIIVTNQNLEPVQITLINPPYGFFLCMVRQGPKPSFPGGSRRSSAGLPAS